MNELENCYEKLQEESGIEVGDTVRVLRKVETYEMGWRNTWLDSVMNKYIGKIFKVIDISRNRGILLDCGWGFPFFALEIIEKKKKYDFSDLETVKKLNKELWEWLAEDPKNRRKSGWPKWERNGGDIPEVLNDCFLCEHSAQECENCPGKWGNYSLMHGFDGDIPCIEGEYGIFLKYDEFLEDVLRKVYTKIANICD